MRSPIPYSRVFEVCIHELDIDLVSRTAHAVCMWATCRRHSWTPIFAIPLGASDNTRVQKLAYHSVSHGSVVQKAGRAHSGCVRRIFFLLTSTVSVSARHPVRLMLFFLTQDSIVLPLASRLRATGKHRSILRPAGGAGTRAVDRNL